MLTYINDLVKNESFANVANAMKNDKNFDEHSAHLAYKYIEKMTNNPVVVDRKIIVKYNIYSGESEIELVGKDCSNGFEGMDWFSYTLQIIDYDCAPAIALGAILKEMNSLHANKEEILKALEKMEVKNGNEK
jgi:hypothetical protein